MCAAHTYTGRIIRKINKSFYAFSKCSFCESSLHPLSSLLIQRTEPEIIILKFLSTFFSKHTMLLYALHTYFKFKTILMETESLERESGHVRDSGTRSSVCSN